MNSNIHVFTSAAVNYIPKVRILFRSLREFHPEWKLHLLLADKLPDDLDVDKEPFDDVTTADELEIHDFTGWSFCHTITELATAVKPWMLEKLLIESGENGKIIYLDPDTVVFSPLTEIIDALDESNIALTPHQTKPDSDLGSVMDNEICSLKHGIYNLGFIGVSNTSVGRAFARWWAERTYYFCRDDIPNGLFTDQRWIDLVPAFFPGVAIIRSSRFNVATWNLTTRNLSCDENGRFLVDGEPLGFYHFTGFDSGAHQIMAAKNANNNQALKQLITWYSQQIKVLKKDPLTRHQWAYGSFESGALISKEQRLVYRMRRDLQLAFPNPYALNDFEQWWIRQAKKEFPELFDNNSNTSGLLRLTKPLQAGYLGPKSQAISMHTASSLLTKALTHPSTGVKLGRRAWEVLRQEGWTGIKSRLG